VRCADTPGYLLAQGSVRRELRGEEAAKAL